MSDVVRTKLIRPLLVMPMLALLLAAAPARAQVSELDDGEFIAGLAALGLHDLVDHMIANPPADADARGRLLAALAGEYLSNTSNFANWTAALKRTADFYDRIEKGLPKDDPNSVTWATNYAQNLLLVALGGRQQADLFVAYGIASQEQQTAVALAAAEAHKRIVRADTDWFTMQRNLPKQANFITDYVNTGKWADLRDTADLQLPLFNAMAGYLLALQPNVGPYYKALPPDTDPATAQQELVKNALTKITTAIDNGGRAPDQTRARMLVLRGDLRVLSGSIEMAMNDYTEAAGLQTDDAQAAFITDLARAKALQAGGRPEEARQLADSLFDREAASANPFLMILAADRLALLTRAQAAKATDEAEKARLLKESYEPYNRVLNHPALAKWRDGLESFLFSGFAASVADKDDLSAYPGMVRLAAGMNAVQNAQAAGGRGDKAAVKAATERAISVLEPLIGTTDVLSPGDHARAMYFMGVAQFLQGIHGFAAKTFTDLADAHPDNPLGEQGIRIALKLAGDLYPQLKTNPETAGPIADLYERALNVLFAKYPNIDIASNNTYSLASLLRERERWAQAVEAYDKVPADHPFYVESLYEKLFCFAAMWDDATGARRKELAQKVIDAADKFAAAVTAARVPATSDRGKRLRRYGALATVTKADVLNESLGKSAEAMQLVEGMDTKYPDLYDGLRSNIERIRIRSLQLDGKYAEAEARITDLMKSDPKTAGPLVLGLLKGLNAQIAAALEAGNQAEVDKLAPIAVNLAKMLVDWAKQQPDFAGDPQKLLAFELMHGQALAAAGKYEEAEKLYATLYATPAGRSNVNVVEGLADARFHLKRYKEAAKLYNALIEFDQDNRTALYWRSQVRLYTMADLTKSGAKDPRIVNGVRLLQQATPDLGGEPFRTQLLKLSDANR